MLRYFFIHDSHYEPWDTRRSCRVRILSILVCLNSCYCDHVWNYEPVNHCLSSSSRCSSIKGSLIIVIMCCTMKLVGKKYMLLTWTLSNKQLCTTWKASLLHMLVYHTFTPQSHWKSLFNAVSASCTASRVWEKNRKIYTISVLTSNWYN